MTASLNLIPLVLEDPVKSSLRDNLYNLDPMSSLLNGSWELNTYLVWDGK